MTERHDPEPFKLRGEAVPTIITPVYVGPKRKIPGKATEEDADFWELSCPLCGAEVVATEVMKGLKDEGDSVYCSRTSKGCPVSFKYSRRYGCWLVLINDQLIEYGYPEETIKARELLAGDVYYSASVWMVAREVRIQKNNDRETVLVTYNRLLDAQTFYPAEPVRIRGRYTV